METGVLFVIVLVSWIAGLTAFGGGLLAVATKQVAWLRQDGPFYHGMIAFGGGILVAAVTFALLPEALDQLNVLILAATFLAGGTVFALVDKAIGRAKGVGTQFLAMLIDYVPEAISLGAVFGHDHTLGLLLASFIAAQNLPEGYNAFLEITSQGSSTRSTLGTLLGASLLGPLAAFVGYTWLQDIKVVTAGIMSFASGGILYLVFQDIAVQAKIDGHAAPAFGAVLGFAVGMIGNELIHFA